MENTVEKDLMLKTAETLRTLRNERNGLIDKLEVQKIALEITSKMIDSGRLSSNEVLPKLAEFSEKTKEELEITSKALELAQTGVFKIGTISDPDLAHSDNPEDRLKNYILED